MTLSAVRSRQQQIAAELASHKTRDLFLTYTGANAWPKKRPGQECYRILVLDSSFNPPTRAHHGLLTTAIQQYPPDFFNGHLLLFAMRNVDKQLSGASVLQRVQMMEIVARQQPNTAVAVTQYGRFIDKAQCLQQWIQEPAELYFIVGYDTITRLLDQSYYDVPVQQALDPFFQSCRLVCADRPGFDADQVMAQFWTSSIIQRYQSAIQRIQLSDDSLATLSSTRARNASDSAELDTIVDPEIAAFIRAEKLYI